jgi:membrane protease YdiL (CAAX protease family)
MTADPEILPYSPQDEPGDQEPTPAAAPDPYHEPPAALSLEPTSISAGNGLPFSEPVAAGPVPLDSLAAYQVPPPPREVPNLGHTVVLFVMTAILCFLAEAACVGVALMMAPPHHHVPLQGLANDPRALVASQAIGYALTIAFAALIFSAWWHRPFFESIQWNWPAARKRARWLLMLGLVLGFSMSLFGSFLPMPKDPPIVKDIMSNTAGAWYMFIFAVTGAPIFEEFAFRGFLLPSLINLSRWMGRRELLPPAAIHVVAIPLSVLLTTLPFALLHSAQVSAAWGPLLLIAVVSVVLCAS